MFPPYLFSRTKQTRMSFSFSLILTITALRGCLSLTATFQLLPGTAEHQDFWMDLSVTTDSTNRPTLESLGKEWSIFLTLEMNIFELLMLREMLRVLN